jgi:hypothetical protein
MENSFDEERRLIHQKINEYLQRVDAQVQKLRRANFRLIAASLIASALATLLSGLAAVWGPLGGQGPSAWKLTCGAVAGFTALAGLMTGLHQRLSISDRLAKSFACAGRLDALKIAVTFSKKDPVIVAQEFEEIIASQPELLL